MLHKKMLRDMISNKGSYLACLVLIIIGLTVFVSFSIAKDNMYLSKDRLYREQNFAHGFVKVESMPESQVERVTRVEGVKEVSGRLVKEVRMHNQTGDESVYLQLVSQDLEKPERLNKADLVWGEELAGRDYRAWFDSAFVEAHGLKQGETLEIIVEGRVEELIFSGVGLSPEFVYLLRTEAELYPNPEQFGVAFLSLEDMWNLFPDRGGTVNDLTFTLEEGADFQRVEERLEPEVERYGLHSIYPREDQTSHFILIEEIEVLETMAVFFPVLILLVAGFIIFILLKRLVEQQRTQIGILKAFGYTRREVMSHYLSYALILAVAGGVLGSTVGMWVANPLSGLLYEFFKLPEIYEGFSLSYLFLGVLLCVALLGIAGYLGCRNALGLEPAEAMRPPAPPSGGKNILEKIAFFTEMLTVQGKMAVRNLGRSPIRSAFLFFGIMISCALVSFTCALVSEALPTFLFHQYEKVETYDVKVRLAEPLAAAPARQELERSHEVQRVEAMTEVPVQLSYKWREENVQLLGLSRAARLYNILDADGDRVQPSGEGLIISERLAENLGVKRGDTLELETPYLRQVEDAVEVKVVDTIPQYIGMNAFMELSGLYELLRQEPFATSLLVDAGDHPESFAAIHESYRESEPVAGTEGRETMMGLMQEMWETMGIIMHLFVLIGIIFSFTIIYVSSFIILSERSRELASMRVLGMTSREVLAVITFEQWFLSVFAVLAGLPVAQLIMAGFATEWSTDMYAMPANVSAQSFLMGILFTVLSIWVAQRFAFYRVQKLDLVEVLKTRE